MAGADRSRTGRPNPRVGDIIADGPPGTAYYAVRQAEPGKSFVLFPGTHLRYLLPAHLRDSPRLGVFGQLSDSFLLTEPEPGENLADPPRAAQVRALALPRLRRPDRRDLG